MKSGYIAYCSYEYGKALKREGRVCRFRRPEEFPEIDKSMLYLLRPPIPDKKRKIQVKEDWGIVLTPGHVAVGPLRDSPSCETYLSFVNPYDPETFFIHGRLISRYPLPSESSEPTASQHFSHLEWLAQQTELKFEVVETHYNEVPPGHGFSGGKMFDRGYYVVKKTFKQT